MLTNEQKAAALYSSIALGCLNVLMEMEKPKSARHNRLVNAHDQFHRVVDLYRAESFPQEDMDNAGKLLELINFKVYEMYPVEVP